MSDFYKMKVSSLVKQNRVLIGRVAALTLWKDTYRVQRDLARREVARLRRQLEAKS